MTHTHFIGIGGTGLSAIARVLLERGQKVSGSDQKDSPLAESLRQAGAHVYIGHNAGNIHGADLVVRSSAVRMDNIEVLAAQEAGLQVLERIDYLPQLLHDQKTIAVAGSHGKTTTTAMIAWMLSRLDLSPGYIVGGEIQNLASNAHAGSGDIFVIEADEYGYMFWGLTPAIAVITNIEHDHPDLFPSMQDFMLAFQGFVDRILPDGILVAYQDDPGSQQIIEYARQKGIQVLTYSAQDPRSDYSVGLAEPVAGRGYHFSAQRGSTPLAALTLQVPGKHNMANALAALATADLLGQDLEAAAAALAEFRGTGRRFELLGEAQGITIIDDYGHHPTEIAATLSAARETYPGRSIWAVWQPHTYSRTMELLSAYQAAFENADQVLITPVFAARESAPQGFSLQQAADNFKHASVTLADGLEPAAAHLSARVHTGDVVIVFSAGDATQISAALYAELSSRQVVE